MNNSIEKIQAQHDLFNNVLDSYNQSRVRHDLSVIDTFTFRKNIMDTLDKVEDDECLLKSMQLLVDYIADANKISEEVDDLAVALFSALNMKDIPQTHDYLKDVFQTKLSIFCKSESIFRVAFYYIAGMSDTNKSVAENFSFTEHVDFLNRLIKLGLDVDNLTLESNVFLDQLDFSFFRDSHIFTIFQDEQYQSLFSNYLKCYSFLKKSDSLSDKNKDIHQEFVKNFIEYYVYYDMKSFLYTKQGYIIRDIPAEHVADILNNIDFFRYINFAEKDSIDTNSDILNSTRIDKYLGLNTFNTISGIASRFSNILLFLRDKPEIIEDVISNKLKNGYIFSTLVMLSKFKNAFWFKHSFLYKSPVSFINYAFYKHKKIKNYRLKKLAFKILDFIDNEDWNNRLYYLAHNYYDLQKESFDIDELIVNYYLAPEDFFLDNHISSEFIKTRRPDSSFLVSSQRKLNELNKDTYINQIHHAYESELPISVCFFTNEDRNKNILRIPKNSGKEDGNDMTIEKEENNANNSFKDTVNRILKDLERAQSYPSEKNSKNDYNEDDENSFLDLEDINENDDEDISSFLPKDDIEATYFEEKGSEHVEEISYSDFLLRIRKNKKTEMKIAPDFEGTVLNHNVADFVIYDAIAEAELDQHIEDLGDESKGVVSLYKKIKRLGNSRNLYNNDLLFKNIDNLREAFPNFSSFIDHIEGHAILNKRGDNHFYIPPSLLAGDPGIGKTFFLSEMAELLGIKREVIHMETISASWLLTGASAQWKDAKTGLIFNKTINSTHANNIVILDELDKALNTSNYPPANSLLQLFEQHTAKQFKDEYFPLKIDVSKMVWLATANDLSLISEPLLSRLDTFRITNPNFEERKQLANRIYSSIIKSNTWGSSFDSNLADSVLDKLCQPSDSVREMKKTLMNAIKNCAKRDDAKIILEDVSFDTNQSKGKMGFR